MKNISVPSNSLAKKDTTVPESSAHIPSQATESNQPQLESTKAERISLKGNTVTKSVENDSNRQTVDNVTKKEPMQSTTGFSNSMDNKKDNVRPVNLNSKSGVSKKAMGV